MGTSARFMFMAVTPNGRLQALPERLQLPTRLGPCQRFIVACVRSSRSGCSTTKHSGASSGFGGRPRQPPSQAVDQAAFSRRQRAANSSC